MVEIFLLLAILIGMAKRKGSRRRRMTGYMKGMIEENLSLGTLASGVLVSDTWDEAVVERTLISSIKVTWSLDNLTPSQGPFRFGVAHSDYTDAEIQEVIDNAGAWDPGNKISQEISKRLVRTIGVFASETVGSSTLNIQDLVLNDGKPVTTKLNWMLQTGDTLKMWVHNRGADAVSVTVPVLKADGHANLWQR